MAPQRVAGELYEGITGQLFEIGRQLRQPNGYPFDPQLLQKYLQAAIEGRFQSGSSSISVFSITLDGLFKASELVKQGKYDSSNDWITDERFPIKKHVPLDRTIELFEFDHDPSEDEVLEELKRRDLERPTYEDALYFGIKHPEEQRKRPIVFLHEPVRGPHGDLDVLVLHGSAGLRLLDLRWFGRRWPRRDVFAGVRK